MDNGENKDTSKSPLNHVVDHTKSQPARQKKSVNEDSNKAHGRVKSEITDATGGDRKDVKQVLKEASDRKNISAVEKYTGRKPVEKSSVKDMHLKSSTALTDPETARQNFKGTSKANDFGRGKLPANDMFRGSGGRGGMPTINEPDEILKKKRGVINPNEILSQQQPQQQEQKSKVNRRDWMAKTLEKNTLQEEKKTIATQTSKAKVKGLIDDVLAGKTETPVRKPVSKEKEKEIAMNTIKATPSNTIKR